MTMAVTVARQSGDKLLHLAFRQRALEAVHRLAVLEGIDGGNGLDAQLLRDLGILVDIDLHQFHRALGFVDRLFQRRTQLLAGAAPGGPEIHDHRHFTAGL